MLFAQWVSLKTFWSTFYYLNNIRVVQSIVISTGKVAEDPKVDHNINHILDEEHDSTFPEEKDKDDNKGQFEVEADEVVDRLMKSKRGKIT